MPEHVLPLPISHVELPGNTQLDLKAFTVVTGPNSSGKTQLLRDVHAAVTGYARRLVVATKVTYAPPPAFDELLAAAIARGDLERRVDTSGSVTGYRRRQHQLGWNDGAGQENPPHELQRLHEALRKQAAEPQATELQANPLLTFLSGSWCASLFLENRLTLLQDTNTFDYEQTPASNLIQSLFLSRPAQELLETELSRTFDRCVWIDYTRGNMLILRAADLDDAPPGDLRRFPDEVRKYRPLSSEGDGLRSYAAVCITLLLSEQPLCLIDEPELCLHPPQAYALGRFIGAHAQERPRGLVVATHSSHVLRGIVDSTGSPTILRLTRSRVHKFAPRAVDRQSISNAIRNPRTRTESVLDGLFTECAVFCEGEGDRVVYEAAYTAIPTQPRVDGEKDLCRVTRDLRFVPVSGLSANTTLLRMYRSLGIPAAAIVDVDLLTNKHELATIAEACGADEAELTALKALCAEIIGALRLAPPEITAEEFKARLTELAARDYDWAAGDDLAAKDKLATLKNSLARTKAMKITGLAVLDQPLRDKAQAAIDRLERLGLFVLSVGVLESWIQDLMADVSRNDKPAWATAAAARLRDVPARLGEDIWGFVGRIDRFARARAYDLAQMNLAASTDSTIDNAETPVHVSDRAPST